MDPEPASPTAAVLVVGTELTSGLHSDTNGPEVARTLEDAGYDVRSVTALPDDADAITSFLTRALPRHRLIVVTGGLGPTHDDVTREAAARALGRTLTCDEGLLQSLGPAVARHGSAEAGARVLRQAEIIDGARILTPTLGTAPGQVLEHEHGTLALLPGPPHEMRPMLRMLLGDRSIHASPRILRTIGHPESDIQLLVEGALAGSSGIAFTILASAGLVDVILRDGGAGETALDTAAHAAAAELGDACYSTDGSTLAETIVRAAARRGLRLGTAESCTGGMVASALTDVSGSSAAFAGGVVAYADAVKSAILGVSSATLEAHGAVSAETAIAMAEGARTCLGADIAVATTGIAGPTGGSPAKPVGTVWFAIATPAETHAECRMLPGDRDGVRTRATVAALGLLLRALRTPAGSGDDA
ncbi:MAG: nicotinamide-nucleotide amidohydrolase family protein [Coriobacteriia bacterium]|nr:nicotinamide-nucleotide amidohydrolase family protein [Coriobacteriia bacterium]